MEQLVERVSAALAAEYPGAPNGRVREVPDRRSIRWYTTIGLVDRPLGTRGRTVLYGPRHLLQLVAIKRRQAAGRTLAEIQEELAGASEETLAAVARVPERVLVLDEPPPSPAPARGPFWKASPPAPDPLSFTADAFASAAEASPTGTSSADTAQAARPATDAASAGTAPIDTPADSSTTCGTSGDGTSGGASRDSTPGDASRDGTPGGASGDSTPGDASRDGTPGGASRDSTPGGASGDGSSAAGRAGSAEPTGGTTRRELAAALDALGPQPYPVLPLITGIPLGGGVILLLPRHTTDLDRDDIAAAARPLLDLLASRGLTDGRTA
ncbi:MerR family transcriptional regulator [Actinoplanes sp. CA-252034]|uniref:helix-turn-helix domain-containing protein n=1 Tax=Actinoplanes sp. CA-252034 TaxID=3239906 RepID=UPI003D97063B